MNALALLTACVSASAGGTTMTGRDAPDLVVAEWPARSEVNLRNIRGRKALLIFYHTAC